MKVIQGFLWFVNESDPILVVTLCLALHFHMSIMTPLFLMFLWYPFTWHIGATRDRLCLLLSIYSPPVFTHSKRLTDSDGPVGKTNSKSVHRERGLGTHFPSSLPARSLSTWSELKNLAGALSALTLCLWAPVTPPHPTPSPDFAHLDLHGDRSLRSLFPGPLWFLYTWPSHLQTVHL